MKKNKFLWKIHWISLTNWALQKKDSGDLKKNWRYVKITEWQKIGEITKTYVNTNSYTYLVYNLGIIRPQNEKMIILQKAIFEGIMAEKIQNYEFKSLSKLEKI